MGARAQAFGRSRSGFTRKIRARCDNQGLPLGFHLTGGEAPDHGGIDSLMAKPVPKPAASLDDKAYDGDRFRQDLLLSNILPAAPPTLENRKAPEYCDYRRYRDRNGIERMFSFLKQQGRIATRSRKPRYPTSASSTSPQQNSG